MLFDVSVSTHQSNEFNKFYLNNVLYKLSNGNKTVFLLVDSSINLANYDQDTSTNKLLDSLSSHLFLLQLNRVRSNSKTLIGNAFSNVVFLNIGYCNLIFSSSDYLPQFLIVSSIFPNPSSLKFNIVEGDWSKFDQESSILDHLSTDWDKTLGIDKSSIDKSNKTFLERFNSLLDLRAPYTKLSKFKLKFRDKSYITSGIQISIPIKNHYFSKFIKLEEPCIRTEAQNKYRLTFHIATT